MQVLSEILFIGVGGEGGGSRRGDAGLFAMPIASERPSGVKRIVYLRAHQNGYSRLSPAEIVSRTEAFMTFTAKRKVRRRTRREEGGGGGGEGRARSKGRIIPVVLFSLIQRLGGTAVAPCRVCPFVDVRSLSRDIIEMCVRARARGGACNLI